MFSALLIRKLKISNPFRTGDYVSIEEKKPEDNKKGRLIREDQDDDVSDDEERVDMAGITGVKEREERREKFYSVQRNGESQSISSIIQFYY